MITLCTIEEKDKALNYLESRFGLEPILFSDYEFYISQKDRVHICQKKEFKGIKPIACGMLIVRIRGMIKPSTNLFQLFGDKITKNIVNVSKEEVISFMGGNDLPYVSQNNEVTDGFVMIKYLNFNIGCGLLSRGNIKNMVPIVKKLEIKFL